MVTNQKPTGRSASIPAGLAAGAAVSAAVTIAVTAVLGKLIDSDTLQWESVGYGVIVLLLSASFLGSYVAYARIKRRRLVVSLLSGLVYFAMLLSVTALFFGGQYEAVGVTAGLILAGSGTAGLLNSGAGRGGRRKKRRYRSC